MGFAIILAIFFFVVSDGIYQRQLVVGMKKICQDKYNMTYLSHDSESITCGDSEGHQAKERYSAVVG